MVADTVTAGAHTGGERWIGCGGAQACAHWGLPSAAGAGPGPDCFAETACEIRRISDKGAQANNPTINPYFTGV